MVFEAVAMLSVFISRNSDTKDFIIVGSLTKVKYMKKVFEKLKEVYKDLNYIIPEDGTYAAVIGAVKNSIDKAIF